MWPSCRVAKNEEMPGNVAIIQTYCSNQVTLDVNTVHILSPAFNEREDTAF